MPFSKKNIQFLHNHNHNFNFSFFLTLLLSLKKIEIRNIVAKQYSLLDTNFEKKIG